jgi:hypothetical protein
MSDPVTFMAYYTAQIQNFVKVLEDLRTQNARITEDPTLIPNYFSSPSARKDIVAQDVTNAQNALVQILFAYDSGSPPQKSELFKVMP